MDDATELNQELIELRREVQPPNMEQEMEGCRQAARKLFALPPQYPLKGEFDTKGLSAARVNSGRAIGQDVHSVYALEREHRQDGTKVRLPVSFAKGHLLACTLTKYHPAFSTRKIENMTAFEAYVSEKRLAAQGVMGSQQGAQVMKELLQKACFFAKPLAPENNPVYRADTELCSWIRTQFENIPPSPMACLVDAPDSPSVVCPPPPSAQSAQSPTVNPPQYVAALEDDCDFD
jgi:hypothetical protein